MRSMSDPIANVRRYHQLTKHSPNCYAPSPGFLDWDSQPNPFRRYAGAPLISLPLAQATSSSRYHDLFNPSTNVSQAPSAASLGLFLELALGLSTWKTNGTVTWSLRNNPSSGNLHPTEGYVILWQTLSEQLIPGVYHYAVHEHALERRATLSAAAAARFTKQLTHSIGALGFTSIHWREEWKYGERAYRYCQHDVGHALGSTRFAAAALGWYVSVDTLATDQDISDCLGLHVTHQSEPEQPDLLALLSTASCTESARTLDLLWRELAAELSDWKGTPNLLSPERVHWPELAAVLPHTLKAAALEPVTVSGIPFIAPSTLSTPATSAALVTAVAPTAANDILASQVIRQRRSAQRMQLGAGISREQFLRCLARTLPLTNTPPFDALPLAPALQLLVYVHAVEGLAPGLYCLLRAPALRDDFRAACQQPQLQWLTVADCDLPLYCLLQTDDLRKTASQLSCFQAIVGHSAFSVSMLANVGKVLAQEGAWAYRRLFWEAGLIGQLLYLEAEASDRRGTGIGCYFDDAVHQLVGLANEGDWQCLYNFTIGTAVEDERLLTLPPYQHLLPLQDCLP
jgi:SagB-type dehydrogenase family enzyme